MNSDQLRWWGFAVAAAFVLVTLVAPLQSGVLPAEAAQPAPTPTATKVKITGQPHTAVTTYFRTLVTKNRKRLATLVCEAWKDKAETQVDSFGAVVPSLSGLSCKTASIEGTDAVVTCKGRLRINYNGNIRFLDLGGRSYVARAENGAWKMCGYKE